MSGLYAYQQTGVEWLVTGSPFKLLAFGPGLGKSRTLLTAAARVGAADILVVCPKSVIGSWLEQVSLWLPGAARSDCVTDLLVRYYGGTRVIVVHPQALAGCLGSSELSYQGCTRSLLVIVDEPHEHRSLHSKWVTALCSWTRFASWVWGSDGTPVFNRLDDLYVLLCMLRCAPRRALWALWCRRGTVRADLIAAGLLHDVDPAVCEADIRLPPCERWLVRAPLPVECTGSYDWRTAGNSSRLRVIAGLYKHTLISRLLKADKLTVDTPTLVFHVHKDCARATVDALSDCGIGAGLVTGQQSSRVREQVFEAFRSGELGWLVLTACAQAGVQLQRARTTVIAEMPYETKARAQATARMWRIGQKFPTREITLAWSHDVDQHVMTSVAAKAATLQTTGFGSGG